MIPLPHRPVYRRSGKSCQEWSIETMGIEGNGPQKRKWSVCRKAGISRSALQPADSRRLAQSGESFLCEVVRDGLWFVLFDKFEKGGSTHPAADRPGAETDHGHLRSVSTQSSFVHAFPPAAPA